MGVVYWVEVVTEGVVTGRDVVNGWGVVTVGVIIGWVWSLRMWSIGRVWPLRWVWSVGGCGHCSGCGQGDECGHWAGWGQWSDQCQGCSHCSGRGQSGGRGHSGVLAQCHGRAHPNVHPSPSYPHPSPLTFPQISLFSPQNPHLPLTSTATLWLGRASSQAPPTSSSTLQLKFPETSRETWGNSSSAPSSVTSLMTSLASSITSAPSRKKRKRCRKSRRGAVQVRRSRWPSATTPEGGFTNS